VPLLQDALCHPRLVEGMEPPLSQERRARAAELLGALGAGAALPTLDDGLRDDSSRVRLECALALVTLRGTEAQEAVSSLVVGLIDRDFLTQTRCEEALQTVGERALPSLIRAAQGLSLTLPAGAEASVTLRGRLTAIRLLGKSGSREALSPLCELLQDPEDHVRSEAILALRGYSDPQVRAALEHTARHDRSKAVRSVARKILEQWRDKEQPLPARRRNLGFWRFW
jgi:HEAT repeat protein